MGDLFVVHEVDHEVDPPTLLLVPLGYRGSDLQGSVPREPDMELLVDDAPQRGDLLEEDEGFLLPVATLNARLARIRWRNGHLRVQSGGNADNPLYEDVDEENWSKHAPYLLEHCDAAWRVDGEGGACQGLGLVLKSHEGYPLTAAERLRAHEVRRVRSDAYKGQNAGFLNPYNFVPLPSSGPVRGTPGGHRQLATAHLSGSIKVRFRAITRLALPGEEVDGVTSPYLVDGQHVLPGSSIGGVVRSFHEALTGSCLRVIDPGYRPVHRDPAQIRDDSWRLGVVEGSGSDPVSVRLCNLLEHSGTRYPAAWVEGRHLPGRPPHRSTDRYAGALADFEIRHGRLEATPGTLKRDAHGDWISLITAKGARQAGHPYHVALGQLGNQSVAVPGAALSAYEAAADGAEDVRRRSRMQEPRLNVNHEGFVGQRQEVLKTLQQGDVLWVRLDAQGEVAQISRAAIWRTPGEGPLGGRVGPFLPCEDPQSLCPSCALFGMVEARDRDGEDRAAQNSYKGHVLFDDVAIDEVEEQETYLVPMGAPRPGSSQFYLVNDDWEGHVAGEGRRPLRDWGSAADESGLRPIRGRKRYWPVSESRPHHRSPVHHPASRYRLSDLPNEGAVQMSSKHRLVSEGAALTATVTFDNVSRAQLGALIVSLDPGHLARMTDLGDLKGLPLAFDFVHQFGRGKGVGLGAVRTEELSLLARGQGRYNPGVDDGAVPTVDELVEEFIASAGTVRETWKALAAMCLLDRVDPRAVAYPPDDAYAEDYRFDFWKKSSGAYVAHPGASGFTVMPAADAPDPFIRPRWWSST